MADHRVPDLSYGHLGVASYDIDEKEWEFSVNTSQSQIFVQITPFKSCLPTEAQDIPETMKTLPKSAQSQMRWMIKSRPEIFPANAIASSFTKTSSATQSHYAPPSYGQLLAIGGAVDAGHQIKRRTHPIIASQCGDAGHVLRLVRLETKYWGWLKRSITKLELFDTASRDVGHWVGIGGTIRQIVPADKEGGVSTLLATRQDSMVTIFRPMYHKQPVRTVIPGAYDKQYPPSRLSPNPVAVLTAGVCGSRRHVDISFNPFYTRQFGVVGDSGRWSIWDIEGPLRTGTTLKLIPGKTGAVRDGFVPSSRGKSRNATDGWHRILWAVNVSTIIVCNRCYIAVFDVETTATCLHSSGDLTRANDWILDIKRSPMHSSYIFVLTTSRVLLIEVISSGAKKDGHDAGIRVVQSYRHFRDVSDETMNLTVLKEDDVSVLVSSNKTPLISSYTFSMTPGHTNATISSRESFKLSASLDNQGPSREMLYATYFVPAPLTLYANRASGLELQLVERNVKFYQVWALTLTFELRSTLCAMYTMPSRTSLTTLHITAPTMRIVTRRLLSEPGVAARGSFVVGDDFASEDELDHASANQSQAYRQHQDFENAQGDLRPRLNWRSIFQRVYMHDIPHGPPNPSLAKSGESMSQLVDNVSHRIEHMTETDTIPRTSLLELSRFSDFSGDLQQSTPMLGEFLKMLQENQTVHETSHLTLSNLSSCPGTDLTTPESSNFPDLLRVYDRVSEHWMISLPLKVSNVARLSKFKIARRMAVELCLSSIAVSICKRPPPAREPLSTGGSIDLASDNELDDSHSFTSSQRGMSLLPDIGSSLPTPSQTPSVYSQLSNDTSESGEDASTARLRQYAVSIKSLPALGESTLLSQWPSIPGSDPAQYIWRSMGDEAVDNVGSHSREEARRRKRMKKFLDRERQKESQGSSQPVVMRSGSQPELGQPAPSSQTVADVPMTQPDRGIFGNRSTKSGKKKSGKRRAAGF